MSLVDTSSDVVVMSETDARDLVDTIKKFSDIMWRQIVQAFEGRAWIALGYGSWDEMCEREFDGARIKLPRSERREVVASLADAGMSTRAIAAATGAHFTTVASDLRGVEKSTPDSDPDEDVVDAEIVEEPIPNNVIGLDGKSYPKPAPKALTPEQQRERDVAEADARHARQVERLISLWPYIDDLADCARRDQVIALIATDHDRRILALIEARLTGTPVFPLTEES